MSLITVDEALVRMVALWESMFDEAHRCLCRDASDGTAVVNAKVEHGVFKRVDISNPGPPHGPMTCAYCQAKAVLAHGRLAMDEQRIGRD